MIKVTTKIITPAALLSLMLAGSAMAQGNSGNAGGVGAEASGGISVEAGGNAGGVGAQASGGVSAEASGKAAGGDDVTGAVPENASDASMDSNFGRVISSIRTGGDAIDTTTAVNSVTVVDVESELRGENVVALENALDDNATEISELRTSIETNADLMAALEAEGIDVSSIVAVEADAEGGVTVYAR